MPGVLSPFDSSAKSAGVAQFARTYCTQSPLFRQKECLSRYFPLHNSHRPLHRLFIPAVHNADDAAALLFFVPAPHCASIKRMTNASTPRAATTPFILGPAYRPILLLLLLAAFGLRLFHLGGESLWYDETFSAYLAAQPAPDLIAHTARDIHPPGYYLLLHAWRALARPSVAFGLEYLLAWPSLMAAMLVLVLTAALARRLFGQPAALLALTFAALHPTEVWFAQEVRMYALAAALYLAALWFACDLLHMPAPAANAKRSRAISLIAYGCLVAASLYVLYYSLFWLIALNLLALLDLWRRRRAGSNAPLGRWIIANSLALLLWLPWLPIFIRQALTPPVAPWREAWDSFSARWAAVTEATAALWIGHTPPGTLNWPWAMLVVVLLASTLLLASRGQARPIAFILALLILPPLGLLAVSALGTPIYFVRYMAPFATLMPIAAAALLTRIDPRPAAMIALSLVLVESAALRSLWTNPRYASDDHRAAVTDLAHAWRPGDAIVVNAGWVYTALETYWPVELPSPLAAHPPAVAGWPRLTALIDQQPLDLSQPLVVRTGTVDGSSTLGWGLPESDFYAMPAGTAAAAVDTLAANAQRIWHYRLYDTVNDPTGILRAVLAEAGDKTVERAYPGPSYLLLERYDSRGPINEEDNNEDNGESRDEPLAQFGENWSLRAVAEQGHIRPGETLYVDTFWSNSAPASPTDAGAIGLSLRLVDDQGTVYAQADTTLALQDTARDAVRHALPLPAATPPGPYSVVLLVYDRETLQPLAPTSRTDEGGDHAIHLATITLDAPRSRPHTPPPIAQFDYLALISHGGLPATVAPRATLNLDLIWVARPSDYQDNYSMEFTLVDSNGAPAQTWTQPLGTPAYPSAAWLTGFPVRRLITLALPPEIAPGSYTLTLGVRRTDDGLTIPPRNAWLPWIGDTVTLGTVTIATNE